MKIAPASDAEAQTLCQLAEGLGFLGEVVGMVDLDGPEALRLEIGKE